MDVENIIIEPWPHLALSIRIRHPIKDVTPEEIQTVFSGLFEEYRVFFYDGHCQVVCYDGDRNIILPALRMAQNEYGI